MIAVDTNLLVYAHRRDSRWHAEAARCLAELASHRTPWGLPWPCLYEFLAITTHPRIYDPPSTLVQAVAQADAWVAAPGAVLLAESDLAWETLKAGLATWRTTGGRLHDAKIAVLCLAHEVTELWSADRDFSAFPELRIVNPLTRRA